MAKNPYFKEVLKPSDNQIASGPHYKFAIGSVESFERKLDEAEKNYQDDEKVSVVYEKDSNWFGNMLMSILPFLLLFVLWRYFLRSPVAGAGGSSVFNFGKSTATLLKKENRSTVTFNDVAGLEEAKAEVKEIVDFLKDPSSYTRLGAKISRGVIIVGPPGTGKTLLVKAVAGEVQVSFFLFQVQSALKCLLVLVLQECVSFSNRQKKKRPVWFSLMK